MKNKKLLLGIGALVLVLVGGLVANSSDLFQGKVRNRRSPQSIVIPSAPSPASSMTSSSSNSLPRAVDLKINGSDGPVVISNGDNFVLSWASTNATSCAATQSSPPIMVWNGMKAVSGQQNAQLFVNEVLEGTLILTCFNNTNGVESASDSLRVIRGSAPTVDLLINGEEDDLALVLPGEEVVLSWTSTNADSCSGWSNLPGWFVGTKPTNGSETFTMPNGAPGTIPASTGAMLTCSSGGGVGINDSVGVYILSVDLKANGSNGPVTAPLGTGSAATGVGTVTLSWNAPNATACTASSSIETVGWTGSKSTSGNAVINVPSARQFSLQCLAPGLASVSDSVMVLFNPN